MTAATQKKIERIEAQLNKIDADIWALGKGIRGVSDARDRKLDILNAKHGRLTARWEEIDPTERDFCYC